VVSTDTDLTGQVAVVTGGAGAIGSALAAAFADRGAAVACLDVADPSEVAGAISGAGGTALSVQADLSDAAAVDGAVDQVLRWQGGVDVLVNMAGLYYGIPRVPFWEIDADTWDAVVNSNVRTAFLCSRAVSAHMRGQGRGRIVHVSSNVSVFGMANFMHYASAKAALVGMTRSMARELGPFGIAVNAVAPGLVRTRRGGEELAPEYFDTVVAGQCLKSPIEVSDVVNAVVFLSCAQSRIITGQTLLVNGGASMGAF
jgi:3-oxoacyl-[acyl-carrier protein] reductase